MPPTDRANPPRVIGEWQDVEGFVEYGYAAGTHYKTTSCSDGVEDMLKDERSAAPDATGHPWEDVRDHVRRGFEGKY
jgi:hypothetical protein